MIWKICPVNEILNPALVCFNVQGLLSSAWGPSDRFAFISPVEPVSLARFSRSMNRVYIPVGHDQEVQVVSRQLLQLFYSFKSVEKTRLHRFHKTENAHMPPLVHA